MKGKPVTYQAVQEQIARFFERSLTGAVSSYRQKTTGALLEELSRLRTDIIKLRREHEGAEERVPELFEDTIMALQSILKSPSFREPDTVWEQILLDEIGKEPEKLSALQDDERFNGLPQDSRALKFRKSMKQLAFKAGGALHRDKDEAYYWTQEIPFQALLKHGLLCRQDVFTETLGFEHSRIALALDHLLAATGTDQDSKKPEAGSDDTSESNEEKNL